MSQLEFNVLILPFRLKCMHTGKQIAWFIISAIHFKNSNLVVKGVSFPGLIFIVNRPTFEALFETIIMHDLCLGVPICL